MPDLRWMKKIELKANHERSSEDQTVSLERQRVMTNLGRMILQVAQPTLAAFCFLSPLLLMTIEKLLELSWRKESHS